MSLWVNVVKRRLVLLNNKIKQYSLTSRFGALMDMPSNYRLLEIQMAIQQIIDNPF